MNTKNIIIEVDSRLYKNWKSAQSSMELQARRLDKLYLCIQCAHDNILHDFNDIVHEEDDAMEPNAFIDRIKTSKQAVLEHFHKAKARKKQDYINGTQDAIERFFDLLLSYYEAACKWQSDANLTDEARHRLHEKFEQENMSIQEARKQLDNYVMAISSRELSTNFDFYKHQLCAQIQTECFKICQQINAYEQSAKVVFTKQGNVYKAYFVYPIRSTINNLETITTNEILHYPYKLEMPEDIDGKYRYLELFQTPLREHIVQGITEMVEEDPDLDDTDVILAICRQFGIKKHELQTL